jgi:Tetratricopeptide repeat
MGVGPGAGRGHPAALPPGARAGSLHLSGGCDTSLGAATSLALTLVEQGEAEPARALGEDTLQRCRTVLGPDHLTSLLAATALTGALSRLGEAERARALGEDTARRWRQLFGPDRPLMLYVARAASGPPG